VSILTVDSNEHVSGSVNVEETKIAAWKQEQKQRSFEKTEYFAGNLNFELKLLGRLTCTIVPIDPHCKKFHCQDVGGIVWGQRSSQQ